MLTQIQLNMLYDAFGKVQLVEMVMKDLGMDLKDIKKVKEALDKEIREKGL